MNLDLIRFVGNDQAKISQIAVIADALDNYVNSTKATPNEVSFESSLELVSSLTIQLTSTTDRSLPSNLKLEVLGCYRPRDGLATKAQVEDGSCRLLSFSSNSSFPF